MNRYRFKTREEFELIGHWNDDDECPQDWLEEMNEYLGQEILNSDCIALCESNDDFNMDGWSFSNHDYVIIEEQETIDRNLLIGCSSKEEAGKVFDYLESLGEKINPDMFSFSNTRNKGDWYFVGYYSNNKAWTVTIEGNSSFGNKVISAKEFLGQTTNTKSSSYRLALPHELFDKNAKTFPTNWCLKINGDNKETLKQWSKKQPRYKDLNVSFIGWLTNDHRDGSYLSYAVNVPDGYVEITYEEFITNVHSAVFYNTTTNALQDVFKDLVVNGSVKYDIGYDPYEQEKPLIENVQSINVNLSTKKKTNKLIF